MTGEAADTENSGPTSPQPASGSGSSWETLSGAAAPNIPANNLPHRRKRPFLATPLDGTESVPHIRPHLNEYHLRSERSQMWLPMFLFAATCLSTFLAGLLLWEPSRILYGFDPDPLRVMAERQTILRMMDVGRGFVYMVCVIGILFAHEMGHYVATRIYKIPSSLPYFIPFPIAPVGTMGAVIAMKGHQANRKEIFDIGIAGPLAGLVFAIPITWYGIAGLDLTVPGQGAYRYDLPLIMRWMYAFIHPGAPVVREVYASQINAMFMAGWVGLLITGLNMLPVSQLDGGHVTYTIFGSYSRWIARLFVIGAIAYMSYRYFFMGEPPIWILMLILVFVIGLYHPPTSDDKVPLGWGRIVLGIASLAIPVLCFPPRGLMPTF